MSWPTLWAALEKRVKEVEVKVDNAFTSEATKLREEFATELSKVRADFEAEVSKLRTELESAKPAPVSQAPVSTVQNAVPFPGSPVTVSLHPVEPAGENTTA